MNSNEATTKIWTKEDIISCIESNEKIEDAHSVIWEITENMNNVNTLISALKDFMHPDTKVDTILDLENNSKRYKIAKINGSLDFIFDHYFPMIEATNIDFKNEQLISSRINIIQLLCNLLIDFPYNINPYYKYHKAMWNILLKIMRRCNPNIIYSSNANITQSHPLILESFRLIIYLFENSRKRISQKTQAARLLSLVANNQNNPLLNTLTVRFIMKHRPPEFGFVTLCKQLIGKGITNIQNLSLIHDILNLPCVRDPTDVFKYLFTVAVSHKTFSNSAMHIVENTFYNFSHLPDFKTWCTLFVKRCFEFILFALHKKGKKASKNDQPKAKYCRRIYLIRRFYDKLYKIKIDWLSSTIQKSAYTIISIDDDSSAFLNNHYDINIFDEDENSKLNIEIDEKIKDDVTSTNVEFVDLKRMLYDIKITLPMIHSSSVKLDNQNDSNDEKKPTISEVRLLFMKNRQKLTKRKLVKKGANQINDDIENLLSMKDYASSSMQSIDSFEDKEYQDNSKDNDQVNLKTNENQDENCMTEMI